MKTRPVISKRKKKADVDWVELKDRYVKSDRDLYEFSFDYTKNQEDPAWTTLQKYASAQHWRECRIQYNLNLTAQSQGKTQALQDETHKVFVETRSKLLNANTTIARHCDVADSFINIYLEALPAIRRAMGRVDWDMLAEADPKGFISAIKDFSNIATVSIEIERKALGLADFKMQLETNSSTTLDVTQKIALLREKDDKELIADYMESLKG